MTDMVHIKQLTVGLPQFCRNYISLSLPLYLHSTGFSDDYTCSTCGQAYQFTYIQVRG